MYIQKTPRPWRICLLVGIGKYSHPVFITRKFLNILGKWIDVFSISIANFMGWDSKWLSDSFLLTFQMFCYIDNGVEELSENNING